MAIQCKHYAFTVWPANLNGKFDSVQTFFTYAKDRTASVKYLVMQLEVAPTTQQVHVQGFVSFQTTKRVAVVANHFGGIDKECFQKMKKGSTPWANKVYCTKEDSRLAGSVPFEYGETPTANGKDDPEKSKLDCFIEIMQTQSLAAAIKEMPSTYVRNCNGLKELDAIYCADRIPRIRRVNVIVCWGPTGTGKSWFAASFDPEHSYSLPDVTVKDRTNFGNYKGQRTLVIEEFQGEIPCNTLLTMCDGYRREYNTKGGWVWSAWDTVIITSNTYPGYWYDDRRDNWGPSGGSPLQRRIDSLMEFKGRWPSSTVSNNGGPDIDVSMLSNRAEMEAFDLAMAQSPASPDSADASEQVPAAPSSQLRNYSNLHEAGSPFVASNFGFELEELLAYSAPPPPPPNVVEEEVVASGTVYMDFMPADHVARAHSQADDDFYLNGEEGDGELDDGLELF